MSRAGCAIGFVLFVVVFCGCVSGSAKMNSSRQPASVSYDWLEEVEGERALKFVREQNEVSLAALKSEPRFPKLEKEIRAIRLAKDRLPSVRLRGDDVYNFWQDDKNVRGLWRKTSLESFRSKSPKWETLIDLDALARAEKENWVWSGAQCLPPENRRCLVSLSRGGKDATVVREFDIPSRSFVRGGFELPEAKNRVNWLDHDHVFVGTDFGPGSLTDSGYPMVVKRWKRGAPLAEAVEIGRGQKSDVSVSAYTVIRPEGRHALFVRSVSFFEMQVSLIGEDGSLTQIGMPLDSQILSVFKNQVLYSLRSDLTRAGRTFKKGSVVSFSLEGVKLGEGVQDQLKVVFEPSSTRFMSDVSDTKDALIVDVLDNVMGKILRLTLAPDGSWRESEVNFAGQGQAATSSVDSFSNHFIAAYESFTVPQTLYLARPLVDSVKPVKLKGAPKRFDASGMEWSQRFATSRDGTKVPYFIVHKKGLVGDGKNPTILYGYGGFEIPMTSSYMAVAGKAWLEKGGVFVIANIRGGGEYGPAWHQAALRENRQRAFDDFAAVAQDLQKSKVTSPAHLGIQGGSNGGLLTAVSFTQRPELFGAVVSSVPLADMLRYHKLLAGASWMQEYGNPDDPKMREVILRYSPLQNLRGDVRYPEVLFITSTKDDRVHPAHARKMVARMRELGHPVLYYENIEGGHGAAANLEQRVFLEALEYTYFWKKLGR